MSERALSLALPDELVEQIAERVAELLKAQASEPEPWIGVREAAAHLACKPQRVYDLVSARETSEIPFRKDGSRLLFRRSDLDTWIEARG